MLESAAVGPVLVVLEALAQPACLIAPCGVVILENPRAASFAWRSPSLIQEVMLRLGDRSFVQQLGDPLFVDTELAELAPWARSLRLRPSHARVAALLLRGACDKEIAEQLGLRLNTVRTYVRVLLRQLGAHSRAEVARRLLAGLR